MVYFSFEAAFMKDYERQLNMTYATSDRDWFIDILKRELEVENGLIRKDKYKGTWYDDNRLGTIIVERTVAI